MGSFLDYYRGRRVFVTGHTGFKGCWLTMWLKLRGAKVCGLALPPDTTPNMFELTGVAEGMTSHLSDIGDLRAVHQALRDAEPEIVFHLAAQSLVRRSYERPVETYVTNVMGTAHLLEAVRTTPTVRAVVVVTSDKVYHNPEDGAAFTEDARLGGTDPYSSSKACAELVTACWRTSFFERPDAPRIASVRAGNVIGGGDWSADRLLPDIARAVEAEREVVLRNPGALRPWQHVLDALSGYLMLGARLGGDDGALAEGWNFGPLTEEAINVAAFADRVVRTWGQGKVVRRADPGARKEARFLRLDSGKSVKRLGWRPVLPIADAIDWSVRWYRTVLADPSCAAEITNAQIAAFAERLRAAGVEAAGREPIC